MYVRLFYFMSLSNTMNNKMLKLSWDIQGYIDVFLAFNLTELEVIWPKIKINKLGSQFKGAYRKLSAYVHVRRTGHSNCMVLDDCFEDPPVSIKFTLFTVSSKISKRAKIDKTSESVSGDGWKWT